jgi:hypothetical protein
VEPRHFTKLVLNSRILKPGLASFRDPKACFCTVGFGFGRKPLAGKDAADEVPDRAVPAALSRMGSFVRAGTRESRIGQVGIEALDGPDYWITEGDPFHPLRKW